MRTRDLSADGAVTGDPIEQIWTFGAPSSEQHLFGPPLSKLLHKKLILISQSQFLLYCKRPGCVGTKYEIDTKKEFIKY
jgi:hypothetical protein